jgi:hypothetical protein
MLATVHGLGHHPVFGVMMIRSVASRLTSTDLASPAQAPRLNVIQHEMPRGGVDDMADWGHGQHGYDDGWQ